MGRLSAANRIDGHPNGVCAGENRSASGREQRGVQRNGEVEQEWLVELGQALRRHAGVRYRGLASALRDAIASGDLPVGAKLPPERELAASLSIGRTTVVSAYNLLQAESLIVTKQGAGTWVVRRP
jgi:regulatory GntR family protein